MLAEQCGYKICHSGSLVNDNEMIQHEMTLVIESQIKIYGY